MRHLSRRVVVATAFAVSTLVAATAQATPIVEDFEEPFVGWESRYLGTLSNLENFYVIAQSQPTTYRGNNPDGLWLDDGDGLYGVDTVDIVFDSAFGATLTSFSIDIAGYTPIRLQVFDMSNALLLDTAVLLTFGAYTDPGVYANYAVSSSNGISRFSILSDGGGQVEGNTGIDNVVVNSDAVQVPDPASLGSLALGWAGLAVFARFQRRRR